ERDSCDPVDLFAGVDGGVVCDALAPPPVAEVDATGELPNHDQVYVLDHDRPEEACLQQSGAGADRPEVRKQAEPLPEAQEPLLWPWRIGIGRLPLRPPHGPQQDSIRSGAALEDSRQERHAVRVDRGAPDWQL